MRLHSSGCLILLYDYHPCIQLWIECDFMLLEHFINKVYTTWLLSLHLFNYFIIEVGQWTIWNSLIPSISCFTTIGAQCGARLKYTCAAYTQSWILHFSPWTLQLTPCANPSLDFPHHSLESLSSSCVVLCSSSCASSCKWNFKWCQTMCFTICYTMCFTTVCWTCPCATPCASPCASSHFTLCFTMYFTMCFNPLDISSRNFKLNWHSCYMCSCKHVLYSMYTFMLFCPCAVLCVLHVYG